MINYSMLAKRRQLNEFTLALQTMCDVGPGCDVQLRDGSIHRVVYEVAAEGSGAVFRTEDRSYVWWQDGSSVTSVDYDIIAFGSDLSSEGKPMITAKQAYEWVKTGHWSLREFTAWFNVQVAIAKNAGHESPIQWPRQCDV